MSEMAKQQHSSTAGSAAFQQAALDLHKLHKGKLGIYSKVPLENREDLSRAYTPGIGAVSQAIASDESLMYELTPKGNMVAVISDGSAVLGLGNIGAAASYPVMEGKCLLFKKFAGIDAIPIVIKTQNTDEIISIIENISCGFGGINLEDFAAPRCFEIEKRLQELIDIPVFHDDQHGTAIVVLAGLLNALKVVNKRIESVKIVLNGAGAAGIAISNLLLKAGVQNIVMLDSRGIIYEGREDYMNPVKIEISKVTNPSKVNGGLKEAMAGADVFIGVSRAGVLEKEMIPLMNENSIVFALANPVPEIMPEDALAAGAIVVASGRSDYPNQLNNVLVFPGMFRGALDKKIKRFDDEMFLKAARALAGLVNNPTREKIIPSPFDPGVSDAIAKEI